LLCDAQTSGGLLIALAATEVAPLLVALQAKRVEGALVGELIEGDAGSIVVV
jgi:selenide,water dikinase